MSHGISRSGPTGRDVLAQSRTVPGAKLAAKARHSSRRGYQAPFAALFAVQSGSAAQVLGASSTRNLLDRGTGSGSSAQDHSERRDVTTETGHLDEAVAAVRRRTSPPRVGLVLGSGLGSFAASLEQATQIPFEQIPHMPLARVSGHSGQLWVGQVDGQTVACLQGRVHLYEGHAVDRVVFGVRVLAAWGCRVVLVTNAAGGIHPDFAAGDLMLIRDHLNLTGANPLVGPNDERAGPRFPDLSQAYDREVRVAAREAARELDIELQEGVYAGVLGPSYETPAEVSMLRTLGADAVGMSTVLEVIALRHRGVRVGGVSCITNLAAGLAPQELDHAEVERTAKQRRDDFSRLLTHWIGRVGVLLDR